MLLVGQQLSNALPTPFWSGAILPSSSRSAHSWRWPLGGARSQTRDFSLTISNNIYIIIYICNSWYSTMVSHSMRHMQKIRSDLNAMRAERSYVFSAT